MENYIELFVAILAGIATAIPLVHKLVQYIKISVKNKNWDNLVGLVITFMKDAEYLFEDGAARKEYVLLKVAESAVLVDYDIDMEKIGDLIDSLCDMAKIVNNNHTEHTDTMEAGE